MEKLSRQTDDRFHPQPSRRIHPNLESVNCLSVLRQLCIRQCASAARRMPHRFGHKLAALAGIRPKSQATRSTSPPPSVLGPSMFDVQRSMLSRPSPSVFSLQNSEFSLSFNIAPATAQSEQRKRAVPTSPRLVAPARAKLHLGRPRDHSRKPRRQRCFAFRPERFR